VIAKSHVRSAFIDSRAVVGTDMWSKAGASSSTSAVGCSIRFVVPTGGLLETWGVWKAGTISAWHRPVRYRSIVPMPRNARVHSDGTVGFTG
jgi:hypothetical protein